MNGKKNENVLKWKWLSMSERVLIQQMDPCWFNVCINDVILKQPSPQFNFCDEISELVLFSKFAYAPTFDPISETTETTETTYV